MFKSPVYGRLLASQGEEYKKLLGMGEEKRELTIDSTVKKSPCKSGGFTALCIDLKSSSVAFRSAPVWTYPPTRAGRTTLSH